MLSSFLSVLFLIPHFSGVNLAPVDDIALTPVPTRLSFGVDKIVRIFYTDSSVETIPLRTYTQPRNLTHAHAHMRTHPHSPTHLLLVSVRLTVRCAAADAEMVHPKYLKEKMETHRETTDDMVRTIGYYLFCHNWVFCPIFFSLEFHVLLLFLFNHHMTSHVLQNNNSSSSASASRPAKRMKQVDIFWPLDLLKVVDIIDAPGSITINSSLYFIVPVHVQTC